MDIKKSIDISKLALEGKAKESFDKLTEAVAKIPEQYHAALDDVIKHTEALTKQIQDQLKGNK